jgi:hypothetical protein
LTTNQSAHRIILLNFTMKEAETIAKAGYNVERGFIGAGSQQASHLPYATPHPLYEYDILFYNSKTTEALAQEFPSQRNGFKDLGFQQTMTEVGTPRTLECRLSGRKRDSSFYYKAVLRS